VTGPDARRPDDQSSAQPYDDSAYLNTQPVEVVPDAESQLRTASSAVASGVIGVLMVVGGIVMVVDALGLRAASDPLGPAAFPIVVGVLLLIVGALLIVTERAPLRDAARLGLRVERGRLLRAAALLAALVGFALVLPFAGYVLSSALLFVVAGLTLDGPRRWRILAIGLVIASLVYLLFDRVIGLTLPAGPWGF